MAKKTQTKALAGSFRRGLRLSSSCYFLQHSVPQHFLPLQQSPVAGGVAVAVPMAAVNAAIKRRYFISPPFCFRWETRLRMHARRAVA